MKTIIAGSRSIDDEEKVYDAIEKARDNGFNIPEVVSGKAEGVDTIGEKWAEKNSVDIKEFPYEQFSQQDGKPAPLVRNDKMAEYAEQAVIVWNGESNGTEYMIQKAREENLEVFIEKTNNTSLSDF